MKVFYASLIIFILSLPATSQTTESLSVYFDFDKYQLNKKALIQLDSFWRSNENAAVSYEYTLKGHCDNRVSDVYNILLSEKRAATIKKYLLVRGVHSESFVSVLGYGETEPVNENNTDEERQMNRRVDIIIIKGNLPAVSLKEKIA